MLSSPCGLLTRSSHSPPSLLVRVPVLVRIARMQERQGVPQTPRVLVNRFPQSGVFRDASFETQRVSRGIFRLLSAHDRQIYGFSHLTDRGLCPVLRTRPDLPTPQICLPSAVSGAGHTCKSTHAFASGFLQPLHFCNNLAFGYPSPPSGWVWTLPDTCVKISDITS